MTLTELQSFLVPNADISSLPIEQQELIMTARKEINFLYTEDDGHTEEQKAQEQSVIEHATLDKINQGA